MALLASRRSPAVVLLAALVAAGCALPGAEWWRARRDSSGQAPDPDVTPEAVVQVYAARAVGWRGVLAVHSWIIVKPSRASRYTRYEVIGWGVDRGAPAIRINRAGPDDYWFGSRPAKLVDVRGDGVDALIAKVEAAVDAYPYAMAYRTWPGPNSNTFIASIGRSVPELRLTLPPTAVGKDFLPEGAIFGSSPSGHGVQLSLFGLAGLMAGWDEGVEVNVLGLTFGIDIGAPALKLPGVGRVGWPRSASGTSADADPAQLSGPR